jgi:DHA1 family tetracycline resistance protein-like MFS transporter
MSLGIGIIIPVIPTLIENLTGEGLSVAAGYGTLMMVAFAGMQFIFAPVLGELSDKYGRKPVLLMSAEAKVKPEIPD